MPMQDLRQEYNPPPLRKADMADDPFDQFFAWFEDARAADILEPNALSLATVTPDGEPAVRTVLLKGVDDATADLRGLVFYTNYASDKGSDLAARPVAAMNFHWDRCHRCVRVVGDVTKVSEAETAEYFATRPWASRIGAWCSQQSAVIEDRAVLEQRFTEMSTKYPEGSDVPVPPTWGGYRVVPRSFEFWQGQASRLHDRLRYQRDGDTWVIERLSP